MGNMDMVEIRKALAGAIEKVRNNPSDVFVPDGFAGKPEDYHTALLARLQAMLDSDVEYSVTNTAVYLLQEALMPYLYRLQLEQALKNLTDEQLANMPVKGPVQ